MAGLCEGGNEPPGSLKAITERKNWTQEQVETALKAIEEGLKIREAARRYGIPESTLRDQIKKSGGERGQSSLGRNPVFNRDQERELSQHIIKLAKLFYGVTPLQLRRIAFEFASKNKIPHTFNSETKLAGKDWLYLYLKRNPDISLRQPEGTSINRISSFNEVEVKLFFSNLETIFSKHVFPPERVFNQDETGISTVQKKSGKVYAAKENGSPSSEDGPIGAVYSCSDNGWINETLFLVWLKHFQQHVKATEDDPVLLVCDNHASHISLEVFNFCRDNHITMVTLPPHTSHRFQPLDLTFFGPLKNALFREYDLFMINHAHERITMSDIAGLLNKAYVKVATMEKAVSGFRSAGIVPLNPEKFSAEDFAPAQEFRNLIVEEDQEAETTPSTSGSSKQANASTDGRLTSGFSPNSSDVVEKDPEGEPTPSTSSHVSVADIAPVPSHSVKNRVERAKHRKQHSEILTSTPVKKRLEEKKGKERSYVEEKGNDERKKETKHEWRYKEAWEGNKAKEITKNCA
ncbi:hypothetical protein ANN_07019 [Periplaneta americana]|uniref:HTH psq-type domain-containing protein n=1 Tax=Periplaneta americana TaxID=6978 RepID=A0ABQ8TH58_PERAM|nr:hypothetical protein ANN_07019 [Periplaneta americana]